MSGKVPGHLATCCSPACVLAKKCTKWQKLSITPEPEGPPGIRNDTIGPRVSDRRSVAGVAGQAAGWRKAVFLAWRVTSLNSPSHSASAPSSQE